MPDAALSSPAHLLEQLPALCQALAAAVSLEQLGDLILQAARSALGASEALITSSEHAPWPGTPHLNLELRTRRSVGALHLRFETPHDLSAAQQQFLACLTAPLASSLERLQDEERRREERAEFLGLTEALDAFARFTELSATTTDVPALALRAAEVLRATLGDVSAAYYELEDDLWKAQAHSEDIAPEVSAAIKAGIDPSAPSFAEAAALGGRCSSPAGTPRPRPSRKLATTAQWRSTPTIRPTYPTACW